MLQRGRRGVGFAVGQEKLAAFFAAQGCLITATDLDGSDESHKPSLKSKQWTHFRESLNKSGLCDPKDFEVRVAFRPVDMKVIPNDLQGFDFAWSTCAFKHCGSLKHGTQFIKKHLSCLRPGGIAIHTVDINLSSNNETLESNQRVIFRLKDIENVCHALESQGHAVEPLDLDPGSEFLDLHIDTIPYWDWEASKPSNTKHLRLNVDGFAATSLALIIRKAT